MNTIIGLLVIAAIIYYFVTRGSRKAKRTERTTNREPYTRPQSEPETVHKPVTAGYVPGKPLVPWPEAQPVAAPVEKPKTPFQIRMENAHKKKVTLAGTAAVAARQGYLRKISEMIEPFDIGIYGINQTEYKGEPAFAVYVDVGESEKVIGMVPALEVADVLKIYDRIFEVEVDVYGGPEYEGDEKNYGAAATFYYDGKEPRP